VDRRVIAFRCIVEGEKIPEGMGIATLLRGFSKAIELRGNRDCELIAGRRSINDHCIR
jgi:hypothetical protein